MSASPDMSDSELAISKHELQSSTDYKQMAVLAIQKRQRENMKWQVIGKLIALAFFGSIMAAWILWDYFRFN